MGPHENPLDIQAEDLIWKPVVCDSGMLEKPTIYGLQEVEPTEPLERDELETVMEFNIAEEATLPLTPEQQEKLAEFVTTTMQLIREAMEMAAEGLNRAARAMRNGADELADRMLYQFNDNPKWWYMYKHAKKKRIRKKYLKLLMMQMLRKLEAAKKEVGL